MDKTDSNSNSKKWKLEPNREAVATGGHKFNVITEDEKICIAQVFKEDHAKRIAAVPLLIEALKDCVFELDFFLDCCSDIEVEQSYKNFLDSASLGHNALAEAGIKQGGKT
jgi:hypothetical protein